MQTKHLFFLASSVLVMAWDVSAEDTGEWFRKKAFPRPPFVNLDPRLEKEVSLAQGATTVSEAVSELRRSTAVGLSVDSALADRRLLCIVSEHALGDVLETISAALSAGWQVTRGDSVASYRLVPGKRSSLGYWERQFRNRVKELLAARELSESELYRMLPQRPQVAVQLLALRPTIDALSLLTEDQLGTVFDRGVLWLPKEKLTPPQRGLFRRLSEGRIALPDAGTGLGARYFGPTTGIEIGVWSRPGTFSGSSCVVRLQPGFPMSVGILRHLGLEVAAYERPQEAREGPLPLSEGVQYEIGQVLGAVARHFGVSIVSSAVDGEGTVTRPLHAAETAGEALSRLRGPFGPVRHVGGAWRLHGLRGTL